MAPARPGQRGEVYRESVGKFAEGVVGERDVKIVGAVISIGGVHRLGLRPCVEQPRLIRPFTPAGDISITGPFLTFPLAGEQDEQSLHHERSVGRSCGAESSWGISQWRVRNFDGGWVCLM